MLNKNTIVLRPILGKEIRQCWKSGYLCATDLLNLYNKKKGIQKELKDFKRLESTIEYESFLNREDPPPFRIYSK